MCVKDWEQRMYLRLQDIILCLWVGDFVLLGGTNFNLHIKRIILPRKLTSVKKQMYKCSLNNHSSWSSPVPPRACDVLGQVAMEALEGLHRGGEHGRQEHQHRQTQHFLHQRNCSPRYLNQCHHVKKTSPPTCFHIDRPCIVELTCHWQEVAKEGTIIKVR